MIKIIFVILMTFLSAVGICDLLHTLWEFLLTPKSKLSHIHITFLDGKNDYSTLLWLSDHIKWYGKKNANRYYVVRSDSTDLDVLESFDNSSFTLIDIQDLQKIGEAYEQ
ncbi:MAG: hypothetical protein J6V50_02535 [Clostridia bacterium]|nr:hypothetical protein [Clostridia bacterium]